MQKSTELAQIRSNRLKSNQVFIFPLVIPSINQFSKVDGYELKGIPNRTLNLRDSFYEFFKRACGINNYPDLLAQAMLKPLFSSHKLWPITSQVAVRIDDYEP